MAKKKKKAKKNVKENSNVMTKELIEEKIKEQVAKTGDKLTEEEREAQVEALKSVFIEGKSPAEAMGLPDEFTKILYKQAYDQYNLGLYQDANNVFRVLCIFEPGSAKYQMGLAATNHQMGNYEIAATLYFVAWYCDLESPIPLFYVSDCFLKQGHPDCAYFMLRLTAEHCGPRQEFSRLKTRCYLMMKHLQEEHGIHKEEKLDEKILEKKEEEGGGEDIFCQLYSALQLASEHCANNPKYEKLNKRCKRIMKQLEEEYGINKEGKVEEKNEEEIGEDIFGQLKAQAEEDLEGAA